MRYYAQYVDDKLIAIGTGLGGAEITKEEYDTLLSEIREKADLVNKLYSGEITIESIKEEWQEEIQRRVNERIEAEKNADPIPAVAGMEYEYGKYYSEDGTIYICQRTGEAAGGKITLHYLPSQLVGQYFEVV